MDRLGRSASYAAVRVALEGDPEELVFWCAWCGEDLPDGVHGQTKFCDPTCRQAARNDRRLTRRAEARAGRTCKECGSTLHAKGTNKQYCSRACGRRWRMRQGAAS